MGDSKLENVFVENLPLIDRIIASLARRHGFSGPEAEDFASAIKLRILEDDYAVFRKFRGDSAIGTYLTVVIAMLARDYRVQRFGRWRPSSAARREGPLAIRLESLVRRHGHRLEEAGEILRTQGETTLSDRQLGELLARLPARDPLRPVHVAAEALSVVEASRDSASDFAVTDSESSRERQRVFSVLEGCLGRHPTEDRLILRMRFWEEMSIADIARALTIDQKPLYRRMERLLGELRRCLTDAGLAAEECSALLDGTPT